MNANIAGLTLLSAVGDFSLKSYVLDNEQTGLYRGVAAYLGITYLLTKSVGEYGVAYVNNMWNAGTSILETIIGVMEGEPLSNVNIVGIGMIIVGGFLLHNGHS
jgi:multidrug transporter EmrE-like cation transporter